MRCCCCCCFQLPVPDNCDRRTPRRRKCISTGSARKRRMAASAMMEPSAVGSCSWTTRLRLSKSEVLYLSVTARPVTPCRLTSSARSALKRRTMSHSCSRSLVALNVVSQLTDLRSRSDPSLTSVHPIPRATRMKYSQLFSEKRR